MSTNLTEQARRLLALIRSKPGWWPYNKGTAREAAELVNKGLAEVKGGKEFLIKALPVEVPNG